MEKEVEEVCKWRKNSWGIYVPQQEDSVSNWVMNPPSNHPIVLLYSPIDGCSFHC